MKNSLLFRLFAATMLCVSYPLMAEVETVKIKWTPTLCRLESCIKGLEQQFRRIKGVADVEMNQADGQAILRWKPDVQFSYPPINTAMSMIGLSVNDIRIRVRGRVAHDSQYTFLISIGDETRFRLLGPIQPQPLTYNVQYNELVHPLTLELQDRLNGAEKDKRIVTIEGPFLQPERSPPLPLQLIVEHLDVSQAPAPQ